MDDFFEFDFLQSLLEIIFVDLTLSGDNALIIALACRSLPPAMQRVGMVFGSFAAIALRIFFTALISFFLKVPLIKLVGSILLVYIAIKFLTEEDDGVAVDAQKNLWNAIRVIMYADFVMSFDNVVTIAAIADGSVLLLVIGLLFSMLFIFYGSAFISRAMDRFPILIWVGGGLIGWIAGAIGSTDPLVLKWLGPDYADFPIYAPIIATVLVLGVSKIIKENSRQDARENGADAGYSNNTGPVLVGRLLEADHYEV